MRSELLLQLLIILLTASIVSLFAIKLYPSVLFANKTANAQVKVSIPAVGNAADAIYRPTNIQIPSLDLSLAVVPASIVDNSWTLYDDKVSWLSTSKTPGKGNVILYAHNKKGLFGDLKKATIGATIIVKANERTYSYRITQAKKIQPVDTDAVLSDKDQLTLYTCDGVFDQRRLIVVALPKN